ncbi:MAG TPA: uracil-DNA glycosylase [Chthoniobacteraceae bacterium]|jgi:DNA polymerase|nr:uracil-DNA glycosylase [Chthoniobacteraceae bacterium]
MSEPDFEAALGYVHGVLADLHSRGVTLVAPASVLQSLAAQPKPAPAVALVKAMAPVEPATPQRPAFRAPEPAPAQAPAARPRAAVPILPAIKPIATPVPAPVPTAPAGVAGSKAARLAAFREKVLACEKCEHLVRFRHNVVFGVGNPEAELMFVGEAPGADEDLRGEPFVGLAGALLTKIITAMGYAREDVYIANVLKCRPDMPAGSSGNRKPTPDEMQTCLPYLQEQIDIIRPRALVALGATAVQGLLNNMDPIGRLRGKWLEFQGIPLMATYHPAYLLRNQSLTEKRKVWEDMLLVLEKLGRPISEKQRAYFTKAGS